jgi:hypothetical protein
VLKRLVPHKRARVIVHRSVIALQPVKQSVQIGRPEHRAQNFDVAPRERQR